MNTPRTENSFPNDGDGYQLDDVLAFARQLERELNAEVLETAAALNQVELLNITVLAL